MSVQADYEHRRWAGGLRRARPEPAASPRKWAQRVTEPAAEPERRNGFDIALTAGFLLLSIAAICLSVWLLTVSKDIPAYRYWLYITLLSGISFCTLTYQLARVGTALRLPKGPAQLPRHMNPAGRDPSVTVLIPTYREEPRVIRHTLLSAVLARHTNRRVVVLVDDPPGDAASVARSLAAVEDVIGILRQPLEQLEAEHGKWKWRLRARTLDVRYEARRLADVYSNVATWLEDLAAYLSEDVEKEFAHVDRFLIDDVVRDLAGHYAARAKTLRHNTPDFAEIDLEYEAIRHLFCRDITAFQRKQFANLSHAANKAMNLNAYIGLMGASFDAVTTQKGLEIREAADGGGALVVPLADFVLTLDADSILKSNYIADLTRIMAARPRAAVVQTPYLAFPGASSYLERIAGATTDIQYLYHQGSTRFGGSFWVGANALLRTQALADIVRVEERDGVTCKIFIQDDTVIEDTGSTIDLLHAGWHVYNHPQALAYSATPSDFGALSIQRRRWSNGGLIIAPRFYRHFAQNPGRPRRMGEVLLRSNYLLSTPVGNVCVLMMMAMVDGSAAVLFATLAAMLPYFLLYGLDLRRLGYRFSDLLGVCALNLILIPVCLSGVADSLRQVITHQRGSFIRTPKIGRRTVVPPSYLVFSIGMVLLMAFYAADAIHSRKFGGALVPLGNLMLYLYAFVFFIGARETLGDLWLAGRSSMGAAAVKAKGLFTRRGPLSLTQPANA
ncbi:glycosyltransferase family 2 protein [Aestuariivirga sp.]|uniref:glycosyltransferase family 2 protein n=1 Tax=Aestuariivirga sp. TaxID=2650926 RepID=UPI003BA8907F